MTTGKMKKLLILGASIRENVIIRHARKLGIYTIVTDYHEDWSLSPAKYAADEAWNISWSEIDTLAAKCTEEQISGILAGTCPLYRSSRKTTCWHRPTSPSLSNPSIRLGPLGCLSLTTRKN